MQEGNALDATVVAALKELGGEEDPGFFGHLVEQFLAEAQDRLKGIRQAMSEKDGAALAKWAHSLKGSSSSMGAVTVAALAAELEALGKRGAADETQGVVERLEQAQQVACEKLRAEARVSKSRAAGRGACE